MDSRRLTDLAQIPENARVCIYGAGGRGIRVLKAIQAFRKDVAVPFVVDTYKTGTCESIPIVSPEKLVEQKDAVDFVIVASIAEYQILSYLLSAGMENILLASQFFCTAACVSSREEIRTKEYHTVLNALDRDVDREFFESVTDIMRVTDSVQRAENAIYDRYARWMPPYCEHINGPAVRYVLDVGLGIGNNSVVFHDAFPEAEIFGFEPETENYVYGLYYDYLQSRERFHFVPLALSDSETEVRFASSNKVANKRTYGKIRDDGERVVQATTVDAFAASHDLGPGGFLKIMVNGCEYPVIQGALETLREYRPQIAIHLIAMGMQEDPAFRTMSFCVEFLKDYRFRFSHYTNSEKHTIFFCIPEELSPGNADSQFFEAAGRDGRDRPDLTA